MHKTIRIPIKSKQGLNVIVDFITQNSLLNIIITIPEILLEDLNSFIHLGPMFAHTVVTNHKISITIGLA